MPFDSQTRSSAGAGAPLAPAERSRMERLPQRGKQAQDTVAGCRERAAADLARAAAMDTAQRRATLDRSAAAWTARGDLLQRLETSFLARFERSAA